MSRPFLYPLRIALFYLLLALMACLWCLAGVTVGPFMAFRPRNWMIAYSWCSNAVQLARWLLAIDYQVKGWENVPERPCVLVSNHQSTWETFFLTGHFEPLTQVLKRELLRVPFFGWAIRQLNPIAINRSHPKEALRQVAAQGRQRLEEGVWVLIFPEGTRAPVGQPLKFSRSAAALAASAGLPVLPVAHNAGLFWPRNGWNKHPGTIQVVIGEPLSAEDNSPPAVAALNRQLESWVRSTQQQLEQEGRQQLDGGIS